MELSGENDVVDGNEYKFDHVANQSHNEEAHNACLQDLLVLCPVWLLALVVEYDGVVDEFLDLLHRVWLLLLLSLCHLVLSLFID